MVFCPECGKSISETDVFCLHCGAKVADTLKSVSPTITLSEKSAGIVLVAVLTLVMGLAYTLVGGLLSIIAIFLPEGKEEIGISIGEPVVFFISGFFLFSLGICGITSAYGLFNLLEWGRKLTIGVYGASILLDIIFISTRESVKGVQTIMFLIGIAILGGVISYLLMPATKKLFK